jgi:ABC-type transport system involved in cytochrome bd biosynthesis fused ATPase/permease subunit
MTQLKRNSVTGTPTDMIVNDTKSGHVNKAVVVKNAMKTYSGAVRPVLNNFCMTVEEGTIYSLLGSSGCGSVFYI